MKRVFDTGNAAITEAAIIAGCDVYAGYPITPSTEIAENMSRRLPQNGGWYLQTEDELAGLYACLGASLGGLKAMTSTSGPGYVLFSDPYGWGISSEIPVVIVDAQRVGPVSGITGAPGQGEFYLSRYPTHGGNFETIVLAPNSVQEAFDMTVRAFYLSERFRTPVTILADQIVTDGWESFEIPENDEELAQRGLEVVERRINRGPEFFPPTDEISRLWCSGIIRELRVPTGHRLRRAMILKIPQRTSNTHTDLCIRYETIVSLSTTVRRYAQTMSRISSLCHTAVSPVLL